MIMTRGRGRGVTRVTGVTRGDGTEGGEKGKGGEETLAHGQADGPIEGRTRGPRRENKKSVKCKKAGEGKLQSGIKSCQ